MNPREKLRKEHNYDREKVESCAEDWAYMEALESKVLILEEQNDALEQYIKEFLLRNES